MYDKEVIKL